MSPGPAIPSDSQVEADNYQGYDDTCGERSVTEALELSGYVHGDGAAAFAVAMFEHIYPGDSITSHGTSLQGLYDGMDWAAQQVGATYPKKKLVNSSTIMDAINEGMYVIVGEYNLLAIGESHFLLFLLGRGDTPQAVHCIDSDKAIDFDPDVWSVAQVIAAGESLFGAGADFGIAFTVS